MVGTDMYLCCKNFVILFVSIIYTCAREAQHKVIEASNGKTGNVRFYAIEKTEKQSLKTLCYSLGYVFSTADYLGLAMFFHCMFYLYKTS